jgi:hypothetical protein
MFCHNSLIHIRNGFKNKWIPYCLAPKTNQFNRGKKILNFDRSIAKMDQLISIAISVLKLVFQQEMNGVDPDNVKG